MRRLDKRVLWATAATLGVAVLWGVVSVAWMVSTMPAELGGPWLDALWTRLPLALLVLLPMAWGVGWGWQRLLARYVTSVVQLADAVRVAATTDVQKPMPEARTPALVALRQTVQDVIDQREVLKADMANQVAVASARIEQERNRLAALMSELTQSVVVCNLDGRILLYNNRAHAVSRLVVCAFGGGRGRADWHRPVHLRRV